MQTQSRRRSILTLAILLSISIAGASAQTANKTYELRIYTANAGKLADFQAVFRSHALPLFAKYGIVNVFDGTVSEGARIDGADAANMLVCILEHPARDAANRSWAALEGDAAWQSALKAAEQNGPLLAKPAVSILMTPTDFSPALEPPNSGSASRICELRKYNTGSAGLPRMVEEFKTGLAAILSKNGMTPVAYWTADDQSAFIYLLAHKDREAARASWSSFMTDFRPFSQEFNARATTPAPTGPRTPDDNRFLAPTDYSPRK